jgi:hypothetical protein
MTIETAKAILNTSRHEVSRLSQGDHTNADRVAFEARMERLRPRVFLRIVMLPR